MASRRGNDEDDDEVQVNVPLASAVSDNSDDIDANGIVPDIARPTWRTRRAEGPGAWEELSVRFARLWEKVPRSWSVERDADVALRHVLTLCGFVSLCVFVFSVPGLLYLIAPRAPAPPGAAPPLDEAASTISGTHGAVAADHALCSALGVRVLKELSGGAVDAAVAALLCQGILAPFASGIGGGAFLLVHAGNDGLSRFYDARETAPAAAHMRLFGRKASSSRFGGMAVAVPGELRGLHLAHSEWGRLPWRDVVLAAVEVGEAARVGKFLAVKLRQMNDTILASESLSRVFTKRVPTKRARAEKEAAAAAELPRRRRGVIDALNDQGTVGDANDKDEHGVTPATADGNATATPAAERVVLLEEGDRLENAALLRTLRRVAEEGPDAFYVEMGRNISSEIRAAGGVMTTRDLADYRAVARTPLLTYYQGFGVLGAPLPSAGGASVAMALNMIAELRFRARGRNGPTYAQLAETLKWVFGARMRLGDAAFVPGAERELRRMLGRRLALQCVRGLDGSRTYPPRHYSRRISSSVLEGGTSHVSVLDAHGVAVSATSSINLPFGAGVMSESSGVLLNDQMDSFTTDSTRANAFGLYPTRENGVKGGKRPLSSMCPTIILKKHEPYLILGGSGGPKAISGVLQAVLNVLDFGDALGDAISAPRVHHQLVPDVLSMEGVNGSSCEREAGTTQAGGGGSKDSWAYWGSVCEKVKEAGHVVEGPAVHGAVQAVLAPGALGVGEDGGEVKVYAASDPRRVGKAAAY